MSGLARGPLTIGEPAPTVEPRLATGEPYRPDTLADGGTVLGLSVRAASVRGLAKRWEGGPRQDDLCLRAHLASGTLIVAVADGVSAAPRSDLGAALAVRQAVAAVARQLDVGDELDWDDVFRCAAWALVDEYRRDTGAEAAGIAEAATSLATTLIVAAVQGGESGFRVRLASVGDSPAYRLAEDGSFEALAAGREDGDGLVATGVSALPSTPAPDRVQERTLDSGDVLLLCTDGLALPLGDGTGEVGQLLAVELADPPDIAELPRLLDFSRSTYDDDRTLVAVWPR